MKQKYNIEITDIQLTVVSDEPEDFITATVAQLDKRIRDLTVHNKRCSKLDAALLCALDSLGEKLKCEKKIKNLEAQISLYEATIKRLKEEQAEIHATAAEIEKSAPVQNTESVARPDCKDDKTELAAKQTEPAPETAQESGGGKGRNRSAKLQEIENAKYPL